MVSVIVLRTRGDNAQTKLILAVHDSSLYVVVQLFANPRIDVHRSNGFLISSS